MRRPTAQQYPALEGRLTYFTMLQRRPPAEMAIEIRYVYHVFLKQTPVIKVLDCDPGCHRETLRGAARATMDISSHGGAKAKDKTSIHPELGVPGSYWPRRVQAVAKGLGVPS